MSSLVVNCSTYLNLNSISKSDQRSGNSSSNLSGNWCQR